MSLTRSRIISSIRSILALPPAAGHSIELTSGNDAAGIYIASGSGNVPYAAFAAGETSEASLKRVICSLPTVSVGMVLDRAGEVRSIVRKSFRTDDFDYIARLEKSAYPSFARPLERRLLEPLSAKFENVLFEVHSAFRDIDGLHAPDALDEVCKLICAKLFDERESRRTGMPIFQKPAYFSTEECAAQIRHLYIRAIGALQDDFKGVFQEALLLSSPAIVRAVEILQHYSIADSSIDIKGRAFQKVLLPAVRSGMGQYFTPQEVIELVVELAQPRPEEAILDPFCGSGHFLTAAAEFLAGRPAGSGPLALHGMEKSDRMVRIAMTDLHLHGFATSNIACTDALLPFPNFPDLQAGAFDLVMTNPPFGVDLTAESVSHLGPFSLAKDTRNATSLEILAIERCLQWLAPGGRLAIVLPDGILSNKNTLYVRDWLRSQARIRAIISLPSATFAPFGANVSTSVLILRKFQADERQPEDYKVFMAAISSIGYDHAGRRQPKDDFAHLTREFNRFIAAEGW